MINEESATAQPDVEAQMKAGLKAIDESIDELKTTMEKALMGNPPRNGCLEDVNAKIAYYLITTGRAPAYCDVGLTVFYDVYDWHVRNRQPIRISRIAEQRMAIQYKFTQLVLRWELAPLYVGTPFDL